MTEPLQRPSRGTMVESATEAVREYIRSNALKVGDVLPSEGNFATEIGVSRPVVREAFHALSALGMSLSLAEAKNAWNEPLESVFPTDSSAKHTTHTKQSSDLICKVLNWISKFGSFRC